MQEVRNRCCRQFEEKADSSFLGRTPKRTNRFVDPEFLKKTPGRSRLLVATLLGMTNFAGWGTAAAVPLALQFADRLVVAVMPLWLTPMVVVPVAKVVARPAWTVALAMVATVGTVELQ